MSDPGSSFPPATCLDIEAYDLAEVIRGYMDWQPDDPEPGPNHPPAYRWGWFNARRDRGPDDGFDGLRAQYIRFSRGLAS